MYGSRLFFFVVLKVVDQIEGGDERGNNIGCYPCGKPNTITLNYRDISGLFKVFSRSRSLRAKRTIRAGQCEQL